MRKWRDPLPFLRLKQKCMSNKERGNVMNKKICFLPAVLLFLFFVLTGCGKKPEPQPEQTAAQPVNVQGEAESGVPEEGSKVRLEDDDYGFVHR